MQREGKVYFCVVISSVWRAFGRTTMCVCVCVPASVHLLVPFRLVSQTGENPVDVDALHFKPVGAARRSDHIYIGSI